jgi:hypothetical protein
MSSHRRAPALDSRVRKDFLKEATCRLDQKGAMDGNERLGRPALVETADWKAMPDSKWSD